MYTPVRAKNEVYRSREHLTLEEVTRLIESAGERGRHRLRDRTLLLLMFRHGLRAGEAVALRWDAIMFDAGAISIRRLKRGESGVHRLQEDELKALAEENGVTLQEQRRIWAQNLDMTNFRQWRYSTLRSSTTPSLFLMLLFDSLLSPSPSSQ